MFIFIDIKGGSIVSLTQKVRIKKFNFKEKISQGLFDLNWPTNWRHFNFTKKNNNKMRGV